ncbi:MAG: gamma-glutamyltransferase [Ferrovibrio sp.]
MAKYCPSKAGDLLQQGLGKHGRGIRQCALLALVALITASCGGSSNSGDGWFGSKGSAGQVDYMAGFRGGVAADEPRAAMVARDILANGGSAADAVAAAALTYAVTYPSGAALGGGGVCIAADAVTKKAETIEFVPPAAKDGGPVAIPAMVRGLGLLQSKYGRLRWEAVVTPAEQLARFGEGASRAFIQAAVETQPPVTASASLRPIFTTATGLVSQEGERRVQPALASVLARLRLMGPSEFYNGALARQIQSDLAAAGSRITPDELAAYAVTVNKPIEVPFENSSSIYTVNTPAGGAIAAWLLEQTYDGGSFLRSSNLFVRGDSVRDDVFAASLGQAYRSDPATLAMNSFGSATVAAMDRRGGTVACAFTMGVAYGSRLVGRETGILFAAPPGIGGDERPYLTAMVGTMPKINQGVLAAAGSGGAPAAAAAAYTVLHTALGKSKKDPTVSAQTQPRMFQANPQSPLLVEPGMDPANYQAMRQRGVTVNEIGRLGRVNIAYCGEGAPRDLTSCSFATDRRGFGLAFGRAY